jgi:heterodisulfide reductase subunit C
MSHAPHAHPSSLADQLRETTGISVAACYQCGKCSAGCPAAAEMDLPSSQVMRLLQYQLAAMDEKALRSEGVWYCLSCDTCSTRCPQEVDVARTMDFVRGEALARGLAHPKAKDILAFHRAFLDSIRTTGRLFEVGLVADYKLRSGHLLKDVALAPKMYLKGKLGLLPHLIKGRDAMKRIFARTAARKG